MTDSVSPSQGSSGSSTRKALGSAVVLLVVLGVVMSFSMMEARKSATTTLQKIFDEDPIMKAIKVESVYLPFQAGLPLSNVFIDLGLIPRKANGTLMITRKDDAKMKNGCIYSETDFNVSERSGNRYYSIEGPQVLRLKACAGAFGGLLDD